MSLRVIAGSAKGRKLKLVPGDSTRPIMDRVKEALFSIIGRNISGTAFLDLYAGTGSVGIEALSRGAAHATFIDTDRRAIQTIYENLTTTHLTERAVVRRLDAFSLLKRRPHMPFDYIYVAPPQYQDLWRKTLTALDTSLLWIPEGVVIIVQIDPKEQQGDDVPLTHLEQYDERRYGKTKLLFLTRIISPEQQTGETANG